MAGSGFGTTTGDMQSAARHVMTVNEQVQGSLAALRNRLEPLSGAWQGQASTAFHGLMARWDGDAMKLNQALRGIGEAIQNSGQQYAQAEEQQAQSLSSIRSVLG